MRKLRFEETRHREIGAYMPYTDAIIVFGRIGCTLKLTEDLEYGESELTIISEHGLASTRRFNPERCPEGYVPSSNFTDDGKFMLSFSDSGNSISLHRVKVSQPETLHFSECLARYYIKDMGDPLTWDMCEDFANIVYDAIHRNTQASDVVDMFSVPVDKRRNVDAYRIDCRVNNRTERVQHVLFYDNKFIWSTDANSEITRRYAIHDNTVVSTIIPPVGNRSCARMSSVTLHEGAVSELMWRKPIFELTRDMMSARVTAHHLLNKAFE